MSEFEPSQLRPTTMPPQASENMHPQLGEQPPGYEEKTDDAPDQPIGPITLVLSNHHIIPLSQTDHNPQPLYELNRGVAVLSDVTSTVTFSRLDHAVRQNIEGEPVVKERKRHIYDLQHVEAPAWVRHAGDVAFSDTPQYWCKSLSRKTAGDVGLKFKTISKLLGTRSGFKVLRVKRESGEYGGPTFMKANGGSGMEIFHIERRKRDDTYVWKDDAGIEIAIEVVADGKHKLEVVKELRRAMLDVMVAAWCLRTWQESALREQKKRSHDGLHGGKFSTLS